MSQKSFRLALCLIGLAVLLSIPEMSGALIGVLAAFSIAFFVAVPAGLLGAALERQGLPVTMEEVLIGAGVLYILLVATFGLLAWRARAAGDLDTARLRTVKALLLTALPTIAYISTRTMAGAWPT